MECNCNYKVGIYKFVGVLPARMGEAQGRGSMWRTAACDVCFTPLTRLGSRLRFVPRHPPFGKKGGLILVPRRRRGTLSLPSLIALGKVASTKPFSKGGCEPDEWSETAIIRSEFTNLSASFPRGWAKRKGAGHCEEQQLTMYVSLHTPASAAAYASCRGTLPWARSALRLMAFAACRRLGKAARQSSVIRRPITKKHDLSVVLFTDYQDLRR